MLTMVIASYSLLLNALLFINAPFLGSYTGYFHNYDWLCHLAAFLFMNTQPGCTKRRPSDKANHSCENNLYMIQEKEH